MKSANDIKRISCFLRECDLFPLFIVLILASLSGCTSSQDNQIRGYLCETPGSEATYTNDYILLQACVIDTNAGEPSIPSSFKYSEAELGSISVYLVHVIADHTSSEAISLLEEHGADVLEYLPHHSYAIRVSAEDLPTINAMDNVSFLEPYQPYYKISPNLFDSDANDIYVRLWSSEDISDAVAVAESLGALVEIVSETSTPLLRVQFDKASLPNVLESMSHLDSVSWMEVYPDREPI